MTVQQRARVWADFPGCEGKRCWGLCGRGWETRKLVKGEWSQGIKVSTVAAKEGEKTDSDKSKLYMIRSSLL